MSKPWPTVKIGDVVRQERDPVGSFDGDRLPVLGVTNTKGVTNTGVAASDDLSKYFRLRPGRFVFNPYRINVGSIGLSSETQNGICSPAYVVFAPTERMDANFLRYFLKSARGNQLINFHGNRGSVRSALRFDDLAGIEIPLPPLVEQRRVLARIEELAAQIHEARTLRHQAAEETEALTGRAAAKIFNEDFPKARLGNVSEFINGDRGKNYPNKVEYVQEGVPWINTGHIEPDGSLSLRWMHYITREKFDSLRSGKVRPGDLVYCLRGATLGKTAIITQFDEGAVASSLVIIRPSTELDSRFAYWFLISPLGREQIFRFDNGSAQPNLSANSVKKYWIPFPSLAEQRRIVAELDALQAEVDALKRLQAETAAEMDALLPSILDRAFKGEL
jgi:type I restriction enzyme S subunit